MTSQGVPSRKRPAPGTSPVVHAPIGSITNYTDTTNQLSDDQFLQWGQDPHAGTTMAQAFPIDTTPYTTMSYAAANQDGPVPVPSDQTPNQLARRPMNQLINRNRSFEQSSVSSVPDSGGDGWGESIAELEQRALVAKREAQAKRKQIPPFVQKLRSFLDEPQYADFIRWSEDGNSFIVLDEDEFARRLIPELFKHNKYASFVRQLNMYGFHKKVGLSDNSMRASERKNKSPSEYANPYFKRGHPDLLWLIQKPKNAPGQGSKGGKGAKIKTEDGEEHDVDDYVDDVGRDERPRNGGQLAITNGQEVMPKDQLAGVYRELQTIRQQQQIISSTISKLRREHEQLYAQAANFQEQHSRHENSINAILTFLATVYNRSLQGHDGPQNLANSFSGIISQDQGNVVDMGDDFTLSSLGNDLGSGTPRFKKQPLLLKAPPQVNPVIHDRATTLSPAGSNYDPLLNRKYSRQSTTPSHTIEEVHDVTAPQATVPTQSTQDGKSQRDIMSMIQLSNAANGVQTTFADFPNIVNSLETSGGNSALTPKQRADMLRQIARDTTVSDPSVASSNNALITPTPPPMPDNYSAQLANTRDEIDNLMKMQAEQDRSVQNLTNLLQPLSPTGQIPGLQDGNVPPPSLDLDQIFNSQDYFTDYNDLDNKGNLDTNDTSTNATTGVPSQAYRATADDRTANDDLFNFDNLANEPVDTDLFGDNAQAPGASAGYFDNYEDFIKPGLNNDDLSNRNTTGAAGGDKMQNTTSPEMGRIIESLTDSESTSPTNTVDENYQALSAGKTADVVVQSPKRRRKV
ncbi:heat shock transcription factor Hsf1, putative [Talaromyces stipitatus ATCC 10500]|uniref:Heat shock transcription factor Hsf1, putative n=1 Tax=Talaromyces stipitatus (strain ATCC 10500 / CBS 375.48 / QM 6759 / NRRL 1006) TaxID=441959 RepID=B8LWT2_TALSN|nr:heat shock transcription factor Hsf1, putative [Talaromyces stipitatus ATCC 10500]EED24565.1 heat shock transcription factor Hsf1, putative [Talaromyces stipitatus ATCC 10500]